MEDCATANLAHIMERFVVADITCHIAIKGDRGNCKQYEQEQTC